MTISGMVKTSYQVELINISIPRERDKNKKKQAKRSLSLVNPMNYDVIGLGKLIRIQTEDDSPAIGAWRGSSGDEDLEPRDISILVDITDIRTIGRLIEIGYRSDDAYIVLKCWVDVDVAGHSKEPDRSGRSRFKIDSS